MSRLFLAASAALIPSLALASDGAPIGGFLLLAVLFVAGTLLYLLPTIVATKRRHKNQGAILVLNLALGWTFLGWVAALVWANTNNVTPPPTPAPEVPSAGPVHPLMALYGNSNAGEAAPLPTHKDCPYCGEQVLFKAIRCKHCHADLSQPAAS